MKRGAWGGYSVGRKKSRTQLSDWAGTQDALGSSYILAAQVQESTTPTKNLAPFRNKDLSIGELILTGVMLLGPLRDQNILYINPYIHTHPYSCIYLPVCMHMTHLYV